MLTLNRRVAGVATVCVLTVPAFAAIVPAASAATSCYASSCTGLDPSQTTCQDDAETVATSSSGDTPLELRYSPSCRAAWARVVNSGWYDGVIGIYNHTNLYVKQVNGAGTFYTRMVDDAGVTSYASFRYQSGYDSTTAY